jgi:thiol-disulfide isomerase/thioredoxin
MKKILFLCIAAGFLLTGFTPVKQHFKINGKIAGEHKYSKAWVFLIEPGSRDTLARATVADTTFVLEGDVDGLTSAVIMFSGYYDYAGPGITMRTKRPVRVILEEGEYEAILGSSDMKSVVRGKGAEQRIGSVFEDMYQIYSRQASELPGIEKKIPTEDALAKLSARIDIDQNRQNMADKLKQLVVASEGSFAATFYAWAMTESLAPETQREVYDLLSDDAKAFRYGKLLLKRVEAKEELAAAKASVAVGKIAPDFTLETPEGKSFSMHSVRGKVKLIDFWASWCGPCWKDNPAVKKMYEEFHAKGLEIIGVSCDTSKEKWLRAIQADGLPWSHGWKTQALKIYGVETIPFTVLVDKNNRIVATNLRGDALRDKVAELLGKKK